MAVGVGNRVEVWRDAAEHECVGLLLHPQRKADTRLADGIVDFDACLAGSVIFELSLAAGHGIW